MQDTDKSDIKLQEFKMIWNQNLRLFFMRDALFIRTMWSIAFTISNKRQM
jgi:hypothetical protein